MSTTKNTEKSPSPIYPPNTKKAILYLCVSFVAFAGCALYLNLFLIFLTSFPLIAASAEAGEQIYKAGVYKEILYYRMALLELINKENGDELGE
jgi:hypothetical protein